jgi:5-formyltetrahydrofolate cyclo-ligase
MEISHQDAKNAVRAEVRARLKKITSGQREVESAKICELLFQQTIWKKARCVLGFAPLADEPDIWPILARGLAEAKTMGLPRFDEQKKEYVVSRVQNPQTELTPGKFSIREPARHSEPLPLNRLDLILVPGVAFDVLGRRLGRGKGVYDRLLAAASGTFCGVAFDEQLVREIPVMAHDISVNRILTPTRWIEL